MNWHDEMDRDMEQHPEWFASPAPDRGLLDALLDIEMWTKPLDNVDATRARGTIGRIYERARAAIAASPAPDRPGEPEGTADIEGVHHDDASDILAASPAPDRPGEPEVKWGRRHYCSRHKRFCEEPVGPHRAALAESGRGVRGGDDDPDQYPDDAER